MDLDALSGVIAYKHTGETVTTVTAAVDRITINHPLKQLCDLELSGQVTFAPEEVVWRYPSKLRKRQRATKDLRRKTF